MTHPTPAAASGPRAARYRGRFAPSPSGPLHFGSLVAALGSYLDARAERGEWLLRIEDVDQPRNVAGAADDIRRTLDAFGFEWDGEVVVQSRRLDFYHAALVRLQLAGDVYPCACSRREVADSATLASVDGGLVYPGTCRAGVQEGRAARAWRMRVPDGDAARLAWTDRVQGAQTQDLAREVGDFILLRADGQFAYQLAVVVDDALQGVTDVVRGADLLGSTGRQIHLQQLLGVPTPGYAHLPVVVNAAGEKLSKQTLAAPIDILPSAAALTAALEFLGHTPPAELAPGPLAELWAWAIANWQLARVPRRSQAQAPAGLAATTA